MNWIFLMVSLMGAWFTYNAYYPAYAGVQRAGVSFFAGWLTSELALHHIGWQALATLAFLALGGGAGVAGKLALLVTLVSWAGLWRCYWGAQAAEQVVEDALRQALGSDYCDRINPNVQAQLAPQVNWRNLALPFPIRHPEVERVRNLTYCRAGGLNLKLDVYRHRSHPQNCPTLLQIHGGAWILGSKNEQGIPLMLEMASRGWVCVSVDYRLSPHATFPDHLIDLKNAIRWIKEHGAEYGANPDFIVVTGGSAGGHLAALVALTANDPAYQPGFEEVDTSVRACVPFYGVYDFADRHSVYANKGLARLLERRVMKAALSDAAEAYDKASPLMQVHEAAPPFFIVHGDQDTLVPVAEARNFAAALRRSTKAAVVYAEIPGAQHAFEIFPSLRTTFVIHGVQRFLAWVYSGYLEEKRAQDRPPTTPSVASVALPSGSMNGHSVGLPL